MTVGLTLLVIASMLGVGAFSIAPVLAQLLPDPTQQTLFWIAGMIYLAFGVASYQQLIRSLHVAGGEFGMLSRYWDIRLGRMAGICSVLAGFAVPAALSCRILAEQLATQTTLGPDYTPALALMTLGLLALFSTRARIAQLLCACTGAVVLTVLLTLIATAIAHLWFAPAASAPATLFGPTDPTRWTQLPLLLCFAFSGFNAVIYLPQIDRIAPATSTSAIRWGSLVGMLLIILANQFALRLAPGEVAAGMDSIRALAHVVPAWGAWAEALWMLCLLSTCLVSLLLAPGIMAMMHGIEGNARNRHLVLFVLLTGLLICLPMTEFILAIGGFFLLLCMSLSVALLLRSDLPGSLTAQEPLTDSVNRSFHRHAALGFLVLNAVILGASLWQQPLLVGLCLATAILTLRLSRRPLFLSPIIQTTNT